MTPDNKREHNQQVVNDEVRDWNEEHAITDYEDDYKDLTEEMKEKERV